MAANLKNAQWLHLSAPHVPDLNAQRLVSKTQQNQSNYYSFLLKGLFITVPFALLPFCSSQLPEFTNHTNFDRGWEFLRLVFIGAALSYGLLSRRRAETEKEIEVQIQSTQNYVSAILQVSPVFDGEIDCTPYFDSSKLQMWSSLYYPCEPRVMVADEDRNRHDMPLFLPVRSLKASISDAETTPAHEITDIPAAGNSETKDRVRNAKREFGLSNLSNVDEKDNDNVVLPSPIPWRSRSGRLEVKGDIGLCLLHSVPPAVSESELPTFESPAFQSSIPWSSRLSSSKAPSSISLPHAVSPHLRPASAQDTATDPEATYVSAVKNNVFSPVNEFITENEPPRKTLNYSESFEGFAAGKSVRSMRQCKSLDSTNRGDGDIDSEQTEIRNRNESKTRKLESCVRKNTDSENLLSIRPDRKNEGIACEAEEKRVSRNRETESIVDGKRKKRKAEVVMVEKAQRKSNFQPPPPPPPPPPILMYEDRRNRQRAKEEIKQSKIQVTAALDNDDDCDDDDEDDDGDNDEEEEEQEVDCSHSDADTVSSESESETKIDESEVDKKADEFIAKFREQIRMQRIKPIKQAAHQQIKNRKTR